MGSPCAFCTDDTGYRCRDIECICPCHREQEHRASGTSVVSTLKMMVENLDKAQASRTREARMGFKDLRRLLVALLDEVEKQETEFGEVQSERDAALSSIIDQATSSPGRAVSKEELPLFLEVAKLKSDLSIEQESHRDTEGHLKIAARLLVEERDTAEKLAKDLADARLNERIIRDAMQAPDDETMDSVLQRMMARMTPPPPFADVEVRTLGCFLCRAGPTRHCPCTVEKLKGELAKVTKDLTRAETLYRARCRDVDDFAYRLTQARVLTKDDVEVLLSLVGKQYHTCEIGVIGAIRAQEEGVSCTCNLMGRINDMVTKLRAVPVKA